MKSNTIYPPMSEREISGAAISREAATQGMVLLKNINGVLPLKGRGKIALFGNGAARTIRGGTGSGDPFNGGLSGGGDQDVDQSLRYHINILNAMETEGFEIVNREQQMAWARCYDLAKREMKDQVMSVFAFPEEPLTTEKLEEYAKETETAICVISRNSGEGNDRFMKKEVSIGDKKYEIGDYRLSAVEMDNLKKLRSAFSSLILVLNVPGSISVQDLEAACADAILLMGQAGQEGGAAVTDILTGKATPSGKLTATWAKKYEDYPTAGNFLQDFNKAVYTEGIYVGYRYFDTFNVEPGYPFGYGLSYTTFALGNLEASLDEDTLVLGVTVENTGAFAGREVVQVYVSAPVSEMDMPEQELKGFQKTMLLAPGEKEDIKIRIPLRNLASYSENAGGYILSKGDYGVRIGTSSRDTKPVCKIRLEQTALTEQVLVELPLTETLEEKKGLTDRKDETIWKDVPVLLAAQIPETLDSRSAYSDEKVVTYATDTSYQPVMPYETVRYVEKKEWKLNDVASGRVSMEEFAAQLDAAQLADLCCGTGWGVQDENNPVIGASSESVPGAAGETTHALESYGVSSIVLADGPGGVRITQQFEATDLESGEKRQVYHYCTAWPVGTLLAQSFDPEILEQVGCGMAADMQAMRIDLLLGPGMNIHRHPLNGRNFEYFSEDPYLTGTIASAQLHGLHQSGVTGTIKHFCGNNQETNRHDTNGVISERALREIYLKGFEIAVKEGHADSVMTTYGPINGVWTAGSFDLTTQILRNDWGFTGFTMTDWWANINRRGQAVDKSDFAAMAIAQNDVYMVCAIGAENDDNILASLKNGTLQRSELQRNAANICRFLMNTQAMARLEGTETKIDIINRPADESDVDESSVKFYELDGNLTINLEDICTDKGTNHSFGLDIKTMGKYRMTLTASSTQSEVAQIPVTLFSLGTAYGTFTWNGTNGLPVSFEADIPLFSKYTNLRLFFAQGGLKMHSITFELISTEL